MRLSWLPALALVVGVGSACTEEATTPIDLDRPSTTNSPVTGAPLPEDDPNAQARQQVIDLAIEECRKDPSREFGVVVIADENGVEVNRYEHPCDEVDLEADTNSGNE